MSHAEIPKYEKGLDSGFIHAGHYVSVWIKSKIVCCWAYLLLANAFKYTLKQYYFKQALLLGYWHTV